MTGAERVEEQKRAERYIALLKAAITNDYSAITSPNMSGAERNEVIKQAQGILNLVEFDGLALISPNMSGAERNEVIKQKNAIINSINNFGSEPFDKIIMDSTKNTGFETMEELMEFQKRFPSINLKTEYNRLKALEDNNNTGGDTGGDTIELYADGDDTGDDTGGDTEKRIPSWLVPPSPGSAVRRDPTVYTNPVTGETFETPTAGYVIHPDEQRQAAALKAEETEVPISSGLPYGETGDTKSNNNLIMKDTPPVTYGRQPAINTTDEYILDPNFKIPSASDGSQAAVMPPMIKNPNFRSPSDDTSISPVSTGTLSAVPTFGGSYEMGSLYKPEPVTYEGSPTQTVTYANQRGQRIRVTEKDGQPITNVPPGYFKLDMNEGGLVTLDQEHNLASKFLGYRGQKSRPALDNFYNSNPSAAARMGKYRNAIRGMKVKMAYGGMVRGFSNGGLEDENQQDGNQQDGGAEQLGLSYQKDIVPMFGDVVGQTMQPVQAAVSYLAPSAGTDIDPSAGQTSAAAPYAEAATVGTVEKAVAPTSPGAATYGATPVSGAVKAETSALKAAQGQEDIYGESEIIAQQQDSSAVSGLEAAQGAAHIMNNPVQRQIETDPVTGTSELVSGSAVDATRAAKFTEQIQAAEARPSEKATVQGQLDGLMQQFEGGNTPAWASGAMRAATATMAARGLSASSMAGQAIIQAAMESALPIAQADASIFAQFEQQNLSNRQQRAMLAAQQRATFLGQEFDQEFQTRVINAAKVSDNANMNFTAEQNIALENSRAVNTMNLNNLSNRQAMVMAEAAALSQLDMANLNNRQQAAVQNAQNFLQMDLANLSNEQQTALFKTQQNVQALFTDQAADNAAKQFNATSENQTNQFFASLASQTSQFNAAQTNSVNIANANAVNSIRQFNSNMQNQRDQFNATNSLVVAQANAQWRQNIDTINTAAQNESNADFAKTINAMTSKNIDEVWQRERDIMSLAFQTAESNADNATSIIMQQMAADATITAAELQAKIEATKKTGDFLSEAFLAIVT